MNVRVFENKEQLYREVADLYINELNSKKDLVLGLATGTTPIPLYQNLIKAYNEKLISFKNIRTFNLDEYTGIEKNHSASYYTFMREQLFNHVDIDLKNVNLPSGEGDVNLNKIAYQNLLKENIIDIQLLGLGSNGHIGFNEPGTSFDSLTHVIELAQKTREDNARLFNSIDEVPTHAITMGIKEIMNAKKIVVIATGLNKADAVYGMVKGDIVESLPASVLQNHKDVYVFIDKEAASKL